MWAITGNQAYAETAIKIMNSWSATLTGGHTNNNGPVQASWTGDVWPRAAEIIRYTYEGWSDLDIAKFQNMLTTQYLPSVVHGTCENGNKELTMSEALINIGVFNDNRAAYDLGVQAGDTRIAEPDVYPTAAPDCRHILAQRYHLAAVLDAYVGPFHDRSSRLSEQSRISLRAVTLPERSRTPFSLCGLASRNPG